MKLAVLCRADSWYFRDLSRAGAKRGHDVQAVGFPDMQVEVGAQGLLSELTGFEAVLVRTMPVGSLEQVVFRMDVLGQLHASGVLVLNSPRSIEISVDKFLTTSLLQRHGLPTPRTIVCQVPEHAMEAFEKLGGDVVVKPLFGGEGRGIARINDAALMLRAAKMLSQNGAVLYLQAFIPHRGCDHRVLVVGENVFGMRRCNEEDWRTNVSRGATAEPLVVDEALADMARRAAKAVDAEIAGVDVLPGVDGRQWVLEVNAVPGWQALGRAVQRDIADEVLAYVESRLSATPARSF